MNRATCNRIGIPDPARLESIPSKWNNDSLVTSRRGEGCLCIPSTQNIRKCAGNHTCPRLAAFCKCYISHTDILPVSLSCGRHTPRHLAKESAPEAHTGGISHTGALASRPSAFLLLSSRAVLTILCVVSFFYADWIN